MAWNAFNTALQAVFTQGAEKRKKLQDSLVKKIKEAYSQLSLHFSGVKKLAQVDPDLGLALAKHLLRSFGSARVAERPFSRDGGVVLFTPPGDRGDFGQGSAPQERVDAGRAE